ncbi:hypothetical protein TPAU25S_02584 [Tsukamurella paurometabola]|uniref:hypothetical protein n=1 Tax=Tsukamurella paurometabola TaxID=2061 RepID=UPI00019F07F8|nr:hypothetical protein [Tsukamurella paurometabola]SUP42328.1 Uncharacterised protein [Tsukamurella paurometabola]
MAAHYVVVGLAAATIGATVLLQRVLPGGLRCASVLLAWPWALPSPPRPDTWLAMRSGSGLLQLPVLLPSGNPRLDLVAAMPLLLFGVASMSEATEQTVFNAR